MSVEQVFWSAICGIWCLTTLLLIARLFPRQKTEGDEETVAVFLVGCLITLAMVYQYGTCGVSILSGKMHFGVVMAWTVGLFVGVPAFTVSCSAMLVSPVLLGVVRLAQAVACVFSGALPRE